MPADEIMKLLDETEKKLELALTLTRSRDAIIEIGVALNHIRNAKDFIAPIFEIGR